MVQPRRPHPHRPATPASPSNELKAYLHPASSATATYALHTSQLEGINNKIKVIKRMAYGYRDDDYFFLKIRAAFPGSWAMNQKKVLRRIAGIEL